MFVLLDEDRSDKHFVYKVGVLWNAFVWSRKWGSGGCMMKGSLLKEFWSQ